MTIKCECGKINDVAEGLEDIDDLECIEGEYLFPGLEDGYVEKCPCLCHGSEAQGREGGP